mmetsp:Transcript_54713/g.127997  ORF Transcript_54713/g.127997 Transcript_54713/m.127997 type:complete len:240 (+) Transcript_54713:125-844(+)
MPTPTWASCIIGTSLAPSPIAKVMGALPVLGSTTFSLTSFTISAFCSGETLHAMTIVQESATSSNFFLLSSSAVIFSKAAPVTKHAFSGAPSPDPTALNSLTTPSNVRAISCTEIVRSGSMVWMFMESVKTLALKPMFRAVSSLSPVSTQSFTPAFRMSSMVSGTPTCSLSSMAVTPTSSTSFSISAATLSNSASFPVTFCFAASHFASQFVNSDWLSFFRPKSNVRKPSLENSERLLL